MEPMNLDIARHNMITQQARAAGVLDDRILHLLTQLPRETFVPEGYRELAFADTSLSLGNGRHMMTPIEEGLILQALNLDAAETVLEVGTGSGYFTALLASQAKHVYSVDICKEMVVSASAHLAALSINNVTLEVGNASQGFAKFAPYDVIVVTGSVPSLPKAFLKALKAGGRIFAIVGEGEKMEAVLVEKRSADKIETRILFETVVEPLQGLNKQNHFEF